MAELREIKHAHFFCGLGGGAKGFNKGQARVGNLQAKFRCIGGIDVDPASIRDFDRLAGVKGTVLDLFSLDQYRAFHRKDPPADWREATTSDVHAAFGHERPNIVFLSAPCKGFSGLLAESVSITDKYQALNGLTLRGVWLMLEAYADDPPELIVFENVPRIATRGRPLLDQIGKLLRHYGYAVAETTHDCGEIGGLAQSRKRFLLVARHAAKVPPFLYEPGKFRLRGVGEVLEKLPLPGDGRGGPMHRMPSLQWKTWVRLAFVEAGADWRSLNRLRIEDGVLADFGIIPQRTWRDGALGVLDWEQSAGAITAQAEATTGRFAVADPRAAHGREGSGFLGVRSWPDHAFTVTANGRPGSGPHSVADPRGQQANQTFGQYGVRDWREHSGAVTGQHQPGGGPNAVADPRLDPDGPRFSNAFRIVDWARPAQGVTSARGALAAVADPRPSDRPDYKQTKYRVTGFEEASGTVIAASTTGNGAFAVADPRPEAMRDRDSYLTQGHYGVVPWREPSAAVTASGQHDNGRWAVADPREADGDMLALPQPTDRLVAVIRARDGTWHRPFTTLELAALQSLFDPEEAFSLDGASDSGWRERIGNAVPSDAAAAIASVMGRTLLMAWSGESFALSMEPIWVQPLAIALAVDVPSFEDRP